MGNQRRRFCRWIGGGPTAGLRMQLWNPTQSLRVPLREEFRLHTCTFHDGGRYFFTYLKVELIARCCILMQRLCQWQTNPILRSTGSCSGASLVRGSAPADHNTMIANDNLIIQPRPLASNRTVKVSAQLLLSKAAQ